MRTLLIVIFSFFQLISISAQSNLEFEHIRIGGQFKSISCIARDHDGFMWISSTEQLIKYDGYKTRVYIPDSCSKQSSPTINCIYVDSENMLWIGTDHGLYRFNPETEKFRFIKLDTIKGNSDNYWVEGIFEDNEGYIWATAYGYGLVKIDKNEGFKKNITEEFSFYNQTLFNFIERKDTKSSLLARINKPADIKLYLEEFRIGESTDVLIVSTSGGYKYTGLDSPNWIENKTGEKIWQMNFDKTADAGEKKYARIQFDTLHLQPGKYKLVYLNQYNEETYYKDLEGISLIKISKSEKYKLGKLINEYKKPKSITTKYIRSLFGEYQNGKKIIWLGHELGLDKLIISEKNKGIESISYFPFSAIKTIYRKLPGPLWIGCSGKGIFQFNEKKSAFEDYNFVLKSNAGNNQNYIGDMVEDESGNSWIKELDEGLFQYNKNTGESQHYVNQYNNPYSISSNFGSGLFIDKAGIIWIDAKGIDKINPNKYRFKRFISNIYNPNSLSSNDVSMVIKDNRKNLDLLWIGTRGGGLNKFDRKKQHFTHFRNSGTNPLGLCSDTISCLLQSKSGELWIGSWGRGISVLINEKEGVFKNFRHNQNNPSGISSDFIKGIFEDSFNQIWVATENGLCLYDKNTGKFECFPIESQVNYDEILTQGRFFEDSFHQLWLSNYYGLYRYDLIKKKLSHYAYKSGNGEGTVYKDVYYTYEDEDKNLWAFTRRGLSKYERDAEKFTTYFKDTSVCSVYEDKSGNFWVGTNNFGLYLFDRTSLQKTSSKLNKNLLKNGYFIFSEDKNGSLWIINGMGNIIQYNLIQNKYRIFDDSDGLQDVFFTIAYQVLSDKGKTSEFYTIGLGGFNIIDIENINKNKNPPEVFITEFMLFNKPVTAGPKSVLKKQISYTSEIILKYNQNHFSFEFAALDYINPLKNRYKYKLEGIDKEWINADANNRIANYTNLDPGKYTFKVIASNNDGVWNTSGRSVEIIIRPPFWASWWAYLIYASLIGLAIYYYRKLLIKREHEKSDYRVKQVEIEKMKELDQHKSEFFANISHEFRTPLSLILGNLEDLRKNDELIPDQKPVLNALEKNSSRLYALVNQLLELSKLDEGKMKIHLKEGNISVALKYIFASYNSLAERKRIKFALQHPQNEINGFWDQDKLEIIVHNLLSNAFKYTNEYGHIVVEYGTLASKDVYLKNSNNIINPYTGDYLYFSINDTGPGIAQNDIERIFNRFEKVTGNGLTYREGMGIGLALTKELIDFQGGYLEVKSKLNEGSRFIFYLPIDKSGYANAIIIENDYSINQDNKFKINQPEKYIPVNSIKKEKDAKELRNKLLIVEDNEDMRIFLYKHLQQKYETDLAEDGILGWDKAIHTIPDLIITDLMMPNRDGISLCSMLKEDHRTSHIPIIILTAKASIENKIEGLKIGADDYLEKPFKIDELLVRIENLIVQRRKLKEKYTRLMGIDTEKIKASDVDEEFIKKALAQVENNLLNEKWSVEDFSDSMNMSRSQLFRKIKALTELSVSDFILSIRLKKAAYLLENNVGSVSEVAYKTGFNDSSYFAKCFKKVYHVSPRSYALRFKHNGK